MNKGLELIEAHHLFGFRPTQIDVLVHPQSIVHGLVEFRDGSMIAQLGPPDMRVPIAHCLAWPDRIDAAGARLDLRAAGDPDLRGARSGPLSGAGLARQALEPAAARRPCSMPRTRSRCDEFLAAVSVSPGLPALVEATLEAAAREASCGSRRASTMRSRLTIFRDYWRVPSCLKLP